MFSQNLFDVCTPYERTVLEAVAQSGSANKAASVLKLHRSTVDRMVLRIKQKASRQGHAPGHFDDGVAPGYLMGKVTVQRSKGVVERTWERMSPDQVEMERRIREAVESMCASIVPALPVQPPLATISNLATLYTFTDYHVGMLAWHQEGGDDWDLKIAQNMGVAAMQNLTAASPAAGTGIVNIQGDFLHFDGLVPVTPLSGHVVDADNRFEKVVDVAITLIRQLVALALQKHEKVILLIAEGNHDNSSSVWLRKLFGAKYEDEPRVEVIQSALPYYVIEWGHTLLCFHHGHLKKNQALPALFAAQFREQWGRAKHAVIHTGHYHHVEVAEHPGAIVIRHPTLAARDAYAARGGYMSERAMSSITYHRGSGEWCQNRVIPSMLEQAA